MCEFSPAASPLLRDADYRPVPVEMASQIAADCGKDKLVILSFDHSCGLLHLQTWGRDSVDRESAQRLGRLILAYVGGDLHRYEAGTAPLIPERGLDAAQVRSELLCEEVQRLADRLLEARELIAFVRDWFRSPANLVSPKWGVKFPSLMATWMERSSVWLEVDPTPIEQAAQAKPPVDQPPHGDDH